MPHTVQGSQAWLDWRMTKVGASDACAIMGVSPWDTPYSLWQLKTGITKAKPMAPHMQRGHDLEDGARQWLYETMGIKFKPDVVYKNAPRDFMVASLDGISDDGSVIAEIKHIKAENHEIAKQGKVPEVYWPQVQQQFACVPNAKRLIYVSCLWVNPQDRIVIEVGRDNDYLQHMLKKIDEFWHCVKTLTPPPLMDRDFKPIKDELLLLKTKRYAELAPFVKEFDSLKAQIKEDCAGVNVTDGVIKVSNYTTKGRIDYDSIGNLKDVDLEGYRKPPNQCVRISLSK